MDAESLYGLVTGLGDYLVTHSQKAETSPVLMLSPYAKRPAIYGAFYSQSAVAITRHTEVWRIQPDHLEKFHGICSVDPNQCGT